MQHLPLSLHFCYFNQIQLRKQVLKFPLILGTPIHLLCLTSLKKGIPKHITITLTLNKSYVYMLMTATAKWDERKNQMRPTKKEREVSVNNKPTL